MINNTIQQIQTFSFLPKQASLEWMQAETLQRCRYHVVWVPKEGQKYYFEQKPSLLRRILRCVGRWLPFVRSYVARPISCKQAKEVLTQELQKPTSLAEKTICVFLAVSYNLVSHLPGARPLPSPVHSTASHPVGSGLGKGNCDLAGIAKPQLGGRCVSGSTYQEPAQYRPVSKQPGQKITLPSDLAQAIQAQRKK